MPLRIRDTSVVPNEDWSYYIQETNYVVKTKNINRLYPMVVAHCNANGIQPPTEQTVVDYCCNNLTIPCYEETTHESLINAWSMNLPKPPRFGCCG